MADADTFLEYRLVADHVQIQPGQKAQLTVLVSAKPQHVAASKHKITRRGHHNEPPVGTHTPEVVTLHEVLIRIRTVSKGGVLTSEGIEDIKVKPTEGRIGDDADFGILKNWALEPVPHPTENTVEFKAGGHDQAFGQFASMLLHISDIIVEPTPGEITVEIIETTMDGTEPVIRRTMLSLIKTNEFFVSPLRAVVGKLQKDQVNQSGQSNLVPWGASVTLIWSGSPDAEYFLLWDKWAEPLPVESSGSHSIDNIHTTTTLVLGVRRGTEDHSRHVPILVYNPPPEIEYFLAEEKFVFAGTRVKLSWSVKHAVGIRIEAIPDQTPAITEFPVGDSITVWPETTTKYKLTPIVREGYAGAIPEAVISINVIRELPCPSYSLIAPQIGFRDAAVYGVGWALPAQKIYVLKNDLDGCQRFELAGYPTYKFNPRILCVIGNYAFVYFDPSSSGDPGAGVHCFALEDPVREIAWNRKDYPVVALPDGQFYYAPRGKGDAAFYLHPAMETEAVRDRNNRVLRDSEYRDGPYKAFRSISGIYYEANISSQDTYLRTSYFTNNGPSQTAELAGKFPDRQPELAVAPENTPHAGTVYTSLIAEDGKERVFGWTPEAGDKMTDLMSGDQPAPPPYESLTNLCVGPDGVLFALLKSDGWSRTSTSWLARYQPNTGKWTYSALPVSVLVLAVSSTGVLYMSNDDKMYSYIDSAKPQICGDVPTPRIDEFYIDRPDYAEFLEEIDVRWKVAHADEVLLNGQKVSGNKTTMRPAGTENLTLEVKNKFVPTETPITETIYYHYIKGATRFFFNADIASKSIQLGTYGVAIAVSPATAINPGTIYFICQHDGYDNMVLMNIARDTYEVGDIVDLGFAGHEATQVKVDKYGAAYVLDFTSGTIAVIRAGSKNVDQVLELDTDAFNVTPEGMVWSASGNNLSGVAPGKTDVSVKGLLLRAPNCLVIDEDGKIVVPGQNRDGKIYWENYGVSGSGAYLSVSEGINPTIPDGLGYLSPQAILSMAYYGGNRYSVLAAPGGGVMMGNELHQHGQADSNLNGRMALTSDGIMIALGLDYSNYQGLAYPDPGTFVMVFPVSAIAPVRLAGLSNVADVAIGPDDNVYFITKDGQMVYYDTPS